MGSGMKKVGMSRAEFAGRYFWAIALLLIGSSLAIAPQKTWAQASNDVLGQQDFDPTADPQAEEEEATDVTVDKATGAASLIDEELAREDAKDAADEAKAAEAPTADQVAKVEEPAKTNAAGEEVGSTNKTGSAHTLGLENVSHETLIDELLRRLASPDERTRLEAGLALRREAKLSDVELLVKTLKKGNPIDKQLFLVETLGGLQDRRAGEGLRFEVEHGDVETARAAVTALGNLNFNWPIPVLVRTLRKAEDEELRKRAASSLGQIGSTQAVYALRTSLATLEDFPGAKNAAFWALEKARGEIDDDVIDNTMPRGRRLQLLYKGTRYFFYHPANRRGAGATKVGLRPWLLVCVHDNDLRAEELFNICWRAAKKRQMAVLVPVIDNMRFPEYGTFNIRGQRFDKRLIELVDHVGEHAALTTREIYLFGYGEGGDFVQRFVMNYPKRIAKAAYESTNYTAPDPEAYFPRGLNRSPLAPDLAVDMYQYLKTDQIVVLRKNSPTLRNGKDFFEAMTHYAEINGIRGRMSVRSVDVKFEIWAEAEKFLFSYD